MKKLTILLFFFLIVLCSCSSDTAKEYQQRMDEHYSATITYSENKMSVVQRVSKIRGNYESEIDFGLSTSKLKLEDDGFFYYDDINVSVGNKVNENLLVDGPEVFETQINDYLSKVKNDGTYQDGELSVNTKDNIIKIKDNNIEIYIEVGDIDE